MNKYKRTYFSFLTIILFIFLIGLFNYGYEKLISSPIADEYNIKLLDKIFNEIRDKYVEEIDESSLIKLGIDGIIKGLDPYTDFYDRKRSAQLKSITTGKYGGIGFYVSMLDGKFTLISPLEDSPAKSAGVNQGDVIVKVDGIKTGGLNADEITDMIKGGENTEVVLTIVREGLPDTINIAVTRKNIRMKDVAYSKILDNNIGYIKLNHFSQKAAGEMLETIREMQKSGLTGLIVDIRGNQGGLLSSAVDVVDLFVKKGELIVSTKGRDKEFNSEHLSKNKPVYYNKSLVILVNNVSASASEILAGAVQDLDRGIIIGKKTFGKGLVQTIFYTTTKTALKMTTARYYTPSGRCIDGTKISSKKGINNKENIYYTNSGRIVHGGGGITPDIIISDENESISELMEQSILLKFALKYAVQHKNLQKVDVDSEILTQFEKFIDENAFYVKKKGINEIKKLTEITDEENYGSEFEKHINSLNEIITKKNKIKIDLSDPLIIYNLNKRMNWVLGGETGKIEATINDDVYIKEAVNILKNKEKYNKSLKNIRVSKSSLN